MAAVLDFAATVDVLLDYCEIVALIGPLDWTSFVHGYRAYDVWYVGETNVFQKTTAGGHSSVLAHARVA